MSTEKRLRKMVTLPCTLIERAEMELRSHANLPDLTRELRKALECSDKKLIEGSEDVELASQ